MRRLPALLFAVTLVSVGLWAQNDPLIGAWRLNLAKSMYHRPGPPPRSGTTTIEAVAGGIRLVADGVNAEGQATHTEYTTLFDGKDYPWKSTIAGNPNPNQDAVAVRKIDNYTYEITDKLKGQVLTVRRWVISRDGRTRTSKVTGRNAQGQAVNNTLVFERQ